MSESGDCHVMSCETDDGTVVYVRGDIDLTTHDMMVRMLDDAAARGQHVIVDLSRDVHQQQVYGTGEEGDGAQAHQSR